MLLVRSRTSCQGYLLECIIVDRALTRTVSRTVPCRLWNVVCDALCTRSSNHDSCDGSVEDGFEGTDAVRERGSDLW